MRHSLGRGKYVEMLPSGEIQLIEVETDDLGSELELASITLNIEEYNGILEYIGERLQALMPRSRR